MATSYLAPGVYVEEVSSGARPIEAVGTSVAAFVGTAPSQGARLHEPVAINNWSEFLRNFSTPGSEGTPLAHGVYGFFQNGGARCYVVNTGTDPALSGDARGRKGLDVLEAIDEVAIVAAPGHADAASYDALLSHCEKLRDRVAILDGPGRVASIEQLTRVATVRPTADEAGPSETAGLRARQSDGGYGAFYYPWITIQDPFGPGKIIDVAPSGHVAGIYARTDALRGVHKAPANELIRGALGVAMRITHQEQEALNPGGVNCIRFFQNEGIRVWGARTVAPSSSEWRYVNVRRLFNMIEESIARSTRWVVFEPNDMSLWKAIRRDVGAFLMLIWRQGALMGSTPEQAFFVKCDAETNPPEVIDAGQVVILVGIAPVKPAEFVIFRIGQAVEGVKVESEAAGGNHG